MYSGYRTPEPPNEEITWLRKYPEWSDPATDASLTYDRLMRRFTANNATIIETSVTVQTKHGTYVVKRDSCGGRY